MSTTRRWIEVGDRVFVRRYEEHDQTFGLIAGGERCLVVDSGNEEVHGAELAAAVGAVTHVPWSVLITHAHWDHCFGTAAFMPCPVWAHPRCQREIAENAEDHRARGMRYFRRTGKPERADRVGEARVVPPTELVDESIELDLGGRVVTLVHPGRGHTGGDVVAHVPDAATIFAGDLVEQRGPPGIGPDSHLLEWPPTMDVLLALSAEVIVPGHGEPVDRAFVTSQRDELTGLAELSRAVRAGELSVDDALARSPYPEEHTRPALEMQ